MADWSLLHREWADYYNPYLYQGYPPYQQQGVAVPQNAPPPQAQPYNMRQNSPALALLLNTQRNQMPLDPIICPQPSGSDEQPPKVESPRELRNKAEKQRRDKLNQSIAELASMVPPVVASNKKIDKTGVLRLTAHYLRAHQYVFCNKMVHTNPDFNPEFTDAVLKLFNGFLITTTYRGIIVVVSKNVHQYLGFPELDLLGQNLVNLTHPRDRQMLLEKLKPRSQVLGPNGELLIPNEPDGVYKVVEGLRREKRSFTIRLKKQGPRSEPAQYVMCHIEGSFRKADGANHTLSRCCQVVRRSRTRGEAPECSGNDIVFIGVVRPSVETFHSESRMESFCMEYRTRHSVDGQIVQCEQRISLVTGYMTHEVKGVNAMNFMHRDDVRWVATALRDMYDQHRLFGESCYRLITKNGQFIYMRTRGHLDIEKDSKAVTTFVCTNTVIGEEEGKRLIKMMKKRIALLTKTNDKLLKYDEGTSNQLVPVEDPKQLVNVVLHMVTDLPTSKPGIALKQNNPASPSHNLSIIPPKKERIVSGVEKIYTIFKNMMGNTPPVQQTPTWTVDEPQDAILDINMINQPLFATENSSRIQEIDESNTFEIFDMPSTSTALCQVEPNYFEEGQLNVTSNNLMFSEAVAVEQYNPEFGLTATSPDVTYHDYLNVQENEITLDDFIFPELIDEPQGIQSPTQIKYHLVIDSEQDLNEAFQQANKNSAANLESDLNKIGMKRPNNFSEVASSNKKISNPNIVAENDFSSEFACLESFLDDVTLNTQIETAIKSLEQTIDPSFPELLISSEVQEILGKIEEEQKNQQQ
ncbi:circadian locomoter output cycles protein kaput-like isoform X2 [Bombyx mandarina]|uniref:Methoprene-tolerant homolog-2 n=2 Tax=Bombyx TaxID=7090 RepID=D4Q9H9_BOMMO|nr:circadian locomoter output cycles protein kaput-like isoform X2 [Bombyx mandarina]BAJ05086.1 methoprene-tolerant homolog-2 [Bombyx mori]